MVENTVDQSDCIISKILISQKVFKAEGLLLHVITYPWKLQFDQEVFLGCGHSYLK